MKPAILFCAVALLPLSAAWQAPVPAVDHHQHLFSPAVSKLSSDVIPIDASDLIRRLEAADIQRDVVLSLAYQFGNPNKPPVPDEYAHVRAENDWTSQQVAVSRSDCAGSAASTRSRTMPWTNSRGVRRIRNCEQA